MKPIVVICTTLAGDVVSDIEAQFLPLSTDVHHYFSQTTPSALLGELATAATSATFSTRTSSISLIMNSQLVYDHVVRREWLPAFAIAWLSLSSLLVILRLTLRATGRNSALGLDDVCVLDLLARQRSNRGTGSTIALMDLLHSFHKRCDLRIEFRLH